MSGIVNLLKKTTTNKKVCLTLLELKTLAPLLGKWQRCMRKTAHTTDPGARRGEEA